MTCWLPEERQSYTRKQITEEFRLKIILQLP